MLKQWRNAPLFEGLPASKSRFTWKRFARLIGAEIRAIPATDLSSDGNRAADRVYGGASGGMDADEKAFVRFGNDLMAIRDNREYRADYDTFEEYCKKRWNRGRSMVNRLIEAAESVNNLVTNCHQIKSLPVNEGQARALSKATDTPEQQVEVWKAVVESGKPITLNAILRPKHVRESECVFPISSL